jgi:hypothetical protein
VFPVLLFPVAEIKLAKNEREMKRLPLNFKSVKLLNQTKDTVLYFLQKIRPQTKTFKCVYLLLV